MASEEIAGTIVGFGFSGQNQCTNVREGTSKKATVRTRSSVEIKISYLLIYHTEVASDDFQVRWNDLVMYISINWDRPGRSVD